MPQIMMLVAPAAKSVIKESPIDEIGRTLIDITEQVFRVPKTVKDVAFDIKYLDYTINEADIQLEIRYTVGEEEYFPGEVFDPSKETKELLINNIHAALNSFLGGKTKTASIFLIPHREAMFKTVDLREESKSECKVHGSIEHMQSATGECPGCRKP